ncbi:MAG TPA: glycosyltransferase family 2 protein [Blastocatellia bacterium]|nr:glycosyltransferase family 2 protein [Blastocatellia bacterium]
MTVEIIFISMLALIAYTYVGYPVLVYLLSRLFEKPVRRADITPTVSVIIAAYNEERDIAQKIENTLALDYPKAKLEIIVASDCSSDRTDEIISFYAQEGVILHRRPERLGKSVVQNAAMKCSTGEIIVFSDATTLYQPDAIRKIVRSFADPEVGCVAGHLLYVDRSTTAVGQGCRSYWGYERFIKQCESRLGSLIGVSGCLYAVRRSSYARLALDMSSDFVIATEMHLQDLRTIYDCEAISTEDTNKRGRDEFRMRVRVIEQTLSALHRYREAFNLRAYPLFGFQMISHKVMRYGVPFFLIAAFLSNMLLASSSEIYHLAFTGQAMFYLAALMGWICDWLGLRIGPLGFPYYFVLANAASLVAFIKFMRGEAHVIWEPIRETGSTKG